MASSKLMDYFAVEKRVLRYGGISLSGNDTTKYKIYSFLLLLYSPYTFTVFAIMELFKPKPFGDYALGLVFYSCGMLDAAKMTVLIFNREKLTKLLDSIQKGVFAPNADRGGEIEEQLVVECMKSNKRVRVGYLFAITMMIGFTIMASIVKRVRSSDSRNWETGFGLFTVVNVTYSPNYEVATVFQDIGYFIGASQFVSFDLIFGNILSHLCVQFKILQNSLKRSVENSHKKMIRYDKKSLVGIKSPYGYHNKYVTSIPLKYLQSTLQEIVNHHLAIIDLVRDLEEIFSAVFLVIYLANMLILCFVLYMYTILPLSDSKMVTFTGTLLTVNFQSFIICYWCNDVSIHSQAVGRAAYEADIVGCPLSFQRDLAFIMRRSFNPTTITAGNFFVITLATFMKTQQAAYSFFMAVHQKGKLKS